MKKILALIAAISLVTLTACGQANSAATLGDVTITQTDFQKTVATLVKEREGVDTSQMQLENGAALNRSQLRFMIITTIFDELAKELKLEISKTEMTTNRQDLVSQSGGEEQLANNLVGAQIASTNFERYIRAIIISDKLTTALKSSGIAEADISGKISELVTAKAKQLKIEINPRYGIWDNETGDVLAKDSAGDAIKSTPAN
ncbi:unannotated protein [freshwater metagenome]|uniref:Unannotated protein n=1 Tax=freshwater metagenome TaxID=449393 RepID=A0A6J7EPX4_9ZZZZ|nr:hypothetical protein [Actinomycetota bacterium]